MQRFLTVGHRLAFPPAQGWVTSHNLARVAVRSLLLGLSLALLLVGLGGSLEEVAAGFVVGLAWAGPSAVELWVEQQRPQNSARWAFTVALAAAVSLGLAFVQLSYALSNLAGGSWTLGVAFSRAWVQIAFPTVVGFTVVMAFAAYFRFRAHVGDPLPDTLALALGLAAVVYVPLSVAAALGGSALGVVGALILCVQFALGAAIACLPLVGLAYWGDWLCARYLGSSR